MRTYPFMAVTAAALLALVSGRSLRQMVTTNFVGEGSNDLSAALLQSESKTGLNTVFSPLGTNAIMAVLAEGARGDTRNQLAKALNLPEDTYAVRNTYNNIFKSMSEHGVLNQPEFKSWFYVYKNNSIEDSYKKVMRDYYLIDIKEVDRYTDIDGEESEHEENLVIKYSSPAGHSELQDETKHQDGTKSVQHYEEGKPQEDAQTVVSNQKKDKLGSEESNGELSSEKVADSLVQESSTKDEEKALMEVTTEMLQPEESQTEINSIVDAKEDPKAYDGKTKQPNNIPDDTTVATTEAVTTESISENQVDPKDDDSHEERPMLEDIIARSLKSELRSQQEMVSALSANRLSSMHEGLRPNSRIIIFNALYFRGNWSIPMKSREENMTFYTSKKQENVEAMTGEGELEMGNVPDLGATVLDLPYQGERYSMLIILPNDKNGLGQVINKLSGMTIRNIRQHLTKRLVKACVPKFRFYTISKPKDALMKIGVKDVFGDQADLSGITGSKGLYLDDVVQLVTLDVDESHSSNVQLTSGIVSETRANPATFNADHPFVFIIRDRTDNLVVVAGTVQNPRNPDYESRNSKND